MSEKKRKCPDHSCDDNGTIAVQIAEDGWEPQPCEWCHMHNNIKRKNIINQKNQK
jgi:hypothetical protein